VCPCSVGRPVFVDRLFLDQCRRPRVEAIDHVPRYAAPLHLGDDLLAAAIAHVLNLLNRALDLERQQPAQQRRQYRRLLDPHCHQEADDTIAALLVAPQPLGRFEDALLHFA
jgi:hypothetical protein